MLGEFAAKRQLEILETLKFKSKGYVIVCDNEFTDDYSDLLEINLIAEDTDIDLMEEDPYNGYLMIFNPTVFRLTEKGKEFLEDQLLSSLTPFTKDGLTYYEAWEKAYRS